MKKKTIMKKGLAIIFALAIAVGVAFPAGATNPVPGGEAPGTGDGITDAITSTTLPEGEGEGGGEKKLETVTSAGNDDKKDDPADAYTVTGFALADGTPLADIAQQYVLQNSEDAASLPAELTAALKDGGSKVFAVQWSLPEGTVYDAAAVGSYVYTGAIAGLEEYTFAEGVSAVPQITVEVVAPVAPGEGGVAMTLDAPFDVGTLSSGEEKPGDTVNLKVAEVKINGEKLEDLTEPIVIDKDIKFDISYTWNIDSKVSQALEEGDWTYAGTLPADLPIEDLTGMEIKLKKDDGTIVGIVTFVKANGDASDLADPWKIKFTFTDAINDEDNVKGTLWLNSYIEVTKITTPGESEEFEFGDGWDLIFKYPETVVDYGRRKVSTGLFFEEGDTATATSTSQYVFNRADWAIYVNEKYQEGAPTLIYDAIIDDYATYHYFKPTSKTDWSNIVKVYESTAKGEAYVELDKTAYKVTANEDLKVEVGGTVVGYRGFSVKIGDEDTTNKAYKVTVSSFFDYIAVPTRENLGANGKTATLKNTVTYDEQSATASKDGTLIASMRKRHNLAANGTEGADLKPVLDSTGKHLTDDGTENGKKLYYVEWTLDINRMSQTHFPNGVTITDTLLGLRTSTGSGVHFLPNPLNPAELVPGATVPFIEVYKLEFVPKGHEFKQGDPVSAGSLDLNRISATSFSFKLDLQGQGYRVKVRSLISDPAWAASEGLKNTYSFEVGDDTKVSYGASNEFHPSFNGEPLSYVKKAENTYSDGGTRSKNNDGTLDWSITMNTHAVDIKTLTLNDWYLVPGNGKTSTMALLKDSIKVTVKYKGSTEYKEIPYATYFDLYDLSDGTAYQDWNSTVEGRKLFVLKLKDDAIVKDGTFNDVISIRVDYKTKYTVKGATTDEMLGTNASVYYRNKAQFHYTVGSTDKPLQSGNLSADQHVSTPACQNGQKTGKINEEIKNAEGKTVGGIDWVIQFNPNGLSYEEPVVLTDVFSAGQMFNGTQENLANALRVYKAEIKSNGTVEKTLLPRRTTENPNGKWRLLSPPVGSTTGFGLELYDLDYWVIIEYSTEFTSVPYAIYTNTATITVKAGDTTAEHNYVAEIDRTDTKKDAFFNKTAAAENAKEGLYKWVITLKPDGKSITDAVITDVMSKGLVLEKESPYAMTVVSKSLTTPAHTVNDYTDGITGETVITIKFTEPITVAHEYITITYYTRINTADAVYNTSQGGYEISNSAHVKGKDVEYWVTENKYASASGGGGTASGELAQMTIKKVDSVTGDVILTDKAQFEIRVKGAATATYPLVSLLDGVSNEWALRDGVTYTIKEITAPEGYLISKDTIEVDVKAQGKDANKIEVSFPNNRGYNLQVTKTDEETGAKLAGAEFTLLDSKGAEVGTIITMADGTGKLGTMVPAGQYTLVETVAPGGYILPTGAGARTSVTIAENEPAGKTINVDVTNEKQPEPPTNVYSLQIIKRNAANTSHWLVGAQFELYKDGQLLGSRTTNDFGVTQFAGLEPGNYVLKETKAPDGYQLPQNPETAVTIAADPETLVVTVEIDNAPIVIPPTEPDPDPEPPTPPTPPVRPRPPIVVVPNPEDNEDEDEEVTGPPPVAQVTNPPSSSGGTGGDTPEATPVAPIEPEGGTGGPGSDALGLGNVPLGGLDSVAWSLLNLMMSIVALFCAVTLTVTLFKRKKLNKYQSEDEDEEEQPEEEVARHRLFVLRLPTILSGLIPGILFLILENIRLPMVWITRWTPLIGAFFIISMVMVLVHFVVKKRAKAVQDNDDDDFSENFAEQHG